jgi:hypothetical protein
MNELDAIFHQAVRHQGADRQKYLDGACGANKQLRRELESLLEADEQTSIGLNRPLIEMLHPTEMPSLFNRRENSMDHRSRAMQQIQCSRGHFYSPEEHFSCPHCGVVGLPGDLGATTSAKRPSMPAHARPRRLEEDEPTRQKMNLDDAPTQIYDPSRDPGESQINPVVGWLVCVKGADRGRDYRIRAQRNFIGRDVSMDICISGDPSISRKNHAILIYDPRTNSFRLAPGEARGLTYLNNESVDLPLTLKAYDAIELGPAGTTKLLFVPFCGEPFQW